MEEQKAIQKQKTNKQKQNNNGKSKTTTKLEGQKKKKKKKCTYLVQQVVLLQDLPADLNQLVLGLRVLGQRVPQRILGQAEQVAVADGANVGRATVARLVARDVQDAHLAEHGPVAERGEDGVPVVGHHAQLAPLDDVHLPPDVPLPADVVPRGEDLQA